MGLRQYHHKRDFKQTPEPKGHVTKGHPRLYVIQKHAASHLHYDFRIELQGVLKSFAIPKGPCLDPKVKRLAIAVEDHPIDYGRFEGIIPKGQYGGGTVMLWDEGFWQPLDEDPNKAYEEGHLRFRLHAKKLNGRWDLIRFKDEKQWFLIKYQDEYAKKESDYDITKILSKSVKSNLSMTEIASQHRPKPRIVLPQGIEQSDFPEFIAPELATLVDKPPRGSQWLHEIKLDGYRILAFKNGSKVILSSRNHKDFSKALQSIVIAVQQLPFGKIVLDGEVVVLDAKGRSDFQSLQNSIKTLKHPPFVYFIFDLLYFEGYDLRPLKLIERKAILRKILRLDIPHLHYSDHLMKTGKALYEYACAHDLEGIISKRIDSPYRSKRSKDWLKVKCLKRQEFVIGGYTEPQGGRAHFGSLYLGVYNQSGQLDYVGNVGTGFSAKSLEEMNQHLLKNKRKTNPFSTKPQAANCAHWLKPLLVCEVEFTEWTQEGYLRHPSFKGLRLDKKASEVIRETVLPLDSLTTKITNPNKILYPEDGIRKIDLLNYYEVVSDYILPHLMLRPLTLLRCPSGDKACFFQRHYNKSTVKTLHALEDSHSKAHERYIYLNDQAGLFGLVQMGVLEIHPWGSTIKHLEEPDIIVFDLDPGPDVPWLEVVKAAFEVRHHLNQYKLQSFVKTTGGKGLHVVLPIVPEYGWKEIKQFTQVFVQFLEKINPKRYISTMSKSKRAGKIFVDYLRNQRSATAIGVYSTRARPHAPVSTPLSWDELSPDKEENTFTIKTLPLRLQVLQEDPWKDFWLIKQSVRL